MKHHRNTGTRMLALQLAVLRGQALREINERARAADLDAANAADLADSLGCGRGTPMPSK
ncbi:hypothetical protein [Pandoraea sp.]|uniref:hypothetical protein n=1 Tax=Pandoraea sp. TaxID=1883445 RepID=UPI0035B30033